MADVWKHFKKLPDERAQCLKCPKILLCKGCSTSGLWRHLKNKHNFTTEEQTQVPSKQPKMTGSSTEKQPLLDPYLKRKSLSEIVARLAALDGISIAAISKSKFIRESVSARGFKLPTAKSANMRLIHDFYKQVKNQTKQEIHRRISENKELISLTTDEWTSPANKRYLNVNVHFADGSCYNLGLSRIHGSCPAEKIVQIIEQVTKDFGIDISSITAVTSDGASVMIKFGRIVPYFHQLCYNHALHLAVQDVLNHLEYDESESTASNELLFSASEDSDDEENYDIEDHSDHSDSETSYPSGTLNTPLLTLFFNAKKFISTFSGLYKSNNRLGKILKQIRSVVRKFRCSPVRNSVLQNKVVARFDKPLQLLLDVKTRWNSTEKMLERYIKLYDCVEDALNELGESSFVSREDFSLVKSFFEGLQPIRLVSEALGRRDATLLTAEGSLSFLLAKLKSLDNSISMKLYEAVLKRINERRNIKLVSLMKFLHNNKSSTSSDELPVISRNQLFKFVKEECNHFFKCTSDDQNDTPPAQMDMNQNQSLQDELEAIIQQHAGSSVMSTMEKPDRENVTQKIIQKELSLFDLTGDLTPGLKFVFAALKSIKPTSTDSERVFSDSANICSKRRTSLSDSSIDKLCFLKSYFNRTG